MPGGAPAAAPLAAATSAAAPATSRSCGGRGCRCRCRSGCRIADRRGVGRGLGPLRGRAVELPTCLGAHAGCGGRPSGIPRWAGAVGGAVARPLREEACERHRRLRGAGADGERRSARAAGGLRTGGGSGTDGGGPPRPVGRRRRPGRVRQPVVPGQPRGRRHRPPRRRVESNGHGWSPRHASWHTPQASSRISRGADGARRPHARSVGAASRAFVGMAPAHRRGMPPCRPRTLAPSAPRPGHPHGRSSAHDPTPGRSGGWPSTDRWWVTAREGPRGGDAG